MTTFELSRVGDGRLAEPTDRTANGRHVEAPR
jgi:hypothetical protein